MMSNLLNDRFGTQFSASEPRLGPDGLPSRDTPIPPERQGYLAEVASTIRDYHKRSEDVAKSVRQVQQLEAAANLMGTSDRQDARQELIDEAKEIRDSIPEATWKSLEDFDSMASAYRSGQASYSVRGKEIPVKTTHETLSGTKVPRVRATNHRGLG